MTAALPEVWKRDYLSQGVVRGTDIIDQGEMRKTPFYNDILRLLDLEYLMAGISLFGEDHRTLLKLFRNPKQDNFSGNDAAQLAVYMPEIRQMMRFAERLYERMVVDTAAYRAGAPAGAATFIVDRNGKIVDANSEAEKHLSSGHMLRARQDRLMAVDTQDDHSISKMIAMALGEPGAPQQDCALIGEGSEFGVHQLLALPTPTQQPPFPWMETLKVAAVVIVDPLRNVRVNPAILKNLYGLTPAEITLVDAMANGVKPTQFARQTNKSTATVQSQRQAVFQKVNVTSQLELMRVLRDLIVSFVSFEKPVGCEGASAAVRYADNIAQAR